VTSSEEFSVNPQLRLVVNASPLGQRLCRTRKHAPGCQFLRSWRGTKNDAD